MNWQILPCARELLTTSLPIDCERATGFGSTEADVGCGSDFFANTGDGGDGTG